MPLYEKILTPVVVFFLSVIFIIFVKQSGFTIPLEITTTNRTTEMAVVGEGKVEAVPDTIYMSVGIIVSSASTSEEAQKQITEINNRIIEAMKKLGIQSEDLKTSNYSINPNYDWKSGTNKISGYSGSATVEIKVKKKDLAPKVISEATDTGANNVQITRSVIDKPEKYREEARSKAIANAKEQAEKLARELGISLGRIVNMVESSPGQVYPFYARSAEMASGKSGGGAPEPDIETGTQTITSTITLYFEKK